MGKDGRPGKVSKGVEMGEESHERLSSASEVLSVCIFVGIGVLPVCVCK